MAGTELGLAAACADGTHRRTVESSIDTVDFGVKVRPFAVLADAGGGCYLADRLPYLNEHRKVTFVFTNVATGQFVTIENRQNGNDARATDDRGTLTYVTVQTGTSVMHNMDGKTIARDTGQSRLKVTFDDAGIPADPSDDVTRGSAHVRYAANIPCARVAWPGVNWL